MRIERRNQVVHALLPYLVKTISSNKKDSRQQRLP